MIQKTRAIVLSLRKYTDNVSIAHLYTANNGRVACAVRGNKYKGVLTPLSQIEITISDRGDKAMGTLTSATLVHVPHHLATDVRRQCIAIFIAEILSLTIRHPMQDDALFEWLSRVAQALDDSESIEDIHLRFLLDYTVFLGIGIDEMQHPEWFVAPAGREQRQRYLREICAYYKEHIEDFREPKSLEVLMEVFDSMCD